MLNILFFTPLVLFFLAVVLGFFGILFHKERVSRLSWWLFLGGTAVLTGYLAARGVVAGRLPLSNQFEFATAFAWGIAVMLIVLQTRAKAEWIRVAAMPMAFLVLSYAALQPREITELMPALKSAWFALHIGSAVFSYASFVLAGCAGVRYLLVSRKDHTAGQLMQIDYLSYRMVALGFLLLTVVILSGAIWAEQAWSAFWTWDPKETWALITWILYAIYLHLRLRKKLSGKVMAWMVALRSGRSSSRWMGMIGKIWSIAHESGREWKREKLQKYLSARSLSSERNSSGTCFMEWTCAFISRAMAQYMRSISARVRRSSMPCEKRSRASSRICCASCQFSRMLRRLMLHHIS